MANRKLFIVLAVLVILALALPASASPIRPNAGFNTNVFPGNDDGSVGPVGIGFTIDLWGSLFSSLYVNNNGNVTFDGPMWTYTPFGLVGAGTKILAPFFADVDTRGASGLVHYGTDIVGGHAAFGVNWPEVGYFAIHTDKLNTFQLVMIDRSDTGPGNFDFEFNYEMIKWETGDASGGSGGMGGAPARAGYSNGLTGVGEITYELCGSGVSGAFIDGSGYRCGPDLPLGGGLRNNTNAGLAGRYLFSGRSGHITPHPTIPEPATLLLLGSALSGLAYWKRRH